MTALFTLIAMFSVLITIYLLLSIDEINVGIIVLQIIIILLSVGYKNTPILTVNYEVQN